MMAPRTEAGEDALRDALAMVRAALDGDDVALSVVAENASWPGLTMGVLAEWLAGVLLARGVGHAELDDWQESRGLR